jgi:hypothetical protein
MITIRRVATVVGLTLAVIVGASIPASAGFADSVATAHTVGTLTVAAPASLTIVDSCATTTTVVRRTVHTDPTTGAQWQTAYSSTSNTVGSSTNVNYSNTTTAAGPGLYETTTTTTTQNTMLTVTASWPASGSRGVSGYVVNAHLYDGSVYPMVQNAAGVLFTSQTVDADNLALQPRLSVTTLTSYGWTAQSAVSGYITC